jgi:hypothetical protein
MLTKWVKLLKNQMRFFLFLICPKFALQFVVARAQQHTLKTLVHNHIRGEFFMENEPKQEGNLSNNTYDLMSQLLEENQSLWRIKNNYKNDAKGDSEAEEFWEELEKDKEDHIKRLTELLVKRISPK